MRELRSYAAKDLRWLADATHMYRTSVAENLPP
jgi:hypothetical protein